MTKKRGARRKDLLYLIGQSLLCLFYYPVFRISVRGRENIPKTGPVLRCSNRVAQWRQVLYMAKEELFRSRFLGGLLRLLGAFPVIRGSGGTDALENAYKLLDENGMVGIFIEGTRSKDGLLQRPKTGAALLAYRTKAPVVPVCITTGDGGLPKKFKRHIINIGKPIAAESLNIKDDSSLELRRASRTIMKEIAALREETLQELGLPSQAQGAAGK